MVDLRHNPADRWQLTLNQRRQATELLAIYTTDLGLSDNISDFLAVTASDLIHPSYRQEMESLSSRLDVPMRDVGLCNLYYDALKVIFGRAFGCTAFAVETSGGILHARNLDWWTERSVLSRYTAVSQFVGASAGTFATVGWPGFVGVFSGIAPGRFAVTLNAVLSEEQSQLANPVVLLLRNVFEDAQSFDQALALLSSTPLPCDCLLLLTGVHPGQMVVIERTPSHYALRWSKDGFISVTNGYQERAVSFNSSGSELLTTSCKRSDRVNALMNGNRPRTPEECIRALSDSQVQMNMTVQQMVFCAATGEYWLQLPN